MGEKREKSECATRDKQNKKDCLMLKSSYFSSQRTMEYNDSRWKNKIQGEKELIVVIISGWVHQKNCGKFYLAEQEKID